jgi:hypothetical protein
MMELPFFTLGTFSCMASAPPMQHETAGKPSSAPSGTDSLMDHGLRWCLAQFFDV